MMTLAIFHSVIRKEEKLIINAAKEKKIKVNLVYILAEVFNP
jgi:hypothetical protein